MSHLLIAILLVAEPDAPVIVELTPTAHEARVAERECKKNLADCEAKDRVAWHWIPITAAITMVVTALVAGGVATAVKK